MSGPTVKVKLANQQRRSRADEPAADPTTNGTTTPTRAARMLALGHHIERLVEEGVLKDYADAARRLGITRARVTQVVGLTLLAPNIQQAVLSGELRVSEHDLRTIVAEVEWERQFWAEAPSLIRLPVIETSI